MQKIPPAEGVVAVLRGEVDAAVFVGGKPVRLFKNLEDLTLPENRKYAGLLKQVHFLALDYPKMLEELERLIIAQLKEKKGALPKVASVPEEVEELAEV